MIPRLFNETVLTLEKALDLRGRRHELLVSNITNQDTPGYEAKDLRFEEVLRAAASISPGGIVKTNPRHLPGAGGIAGAEGEVVIRDNPAGYDGNRVNVEQEMSHMAENSLMYNTSAQLIAKKFQGLVYAIREGR